MRQKECLTLLRFVAAAVCGMSIGCQLCAESANVPMVLLMLGCIVINIYGEIDADRFYENELCDLVKEMTEEFVNLIEGLKNES